MNQQQKSVESVSQLERKVEEKTTQAKSSDLKQIIVPLSQGLQDQMEEELHLKNTNTQKIQSGQSLKDLFYGALLGSVIGFFIRDIYQPLNSIHIFFGGIFIGIFLPSLWRKIDLLKKLKEYFGK